MGSILRIVPLSSQVAVVGLVSGTCDTGGTKSNKLLIRMAGSKCDILYSYVALLLTSIS